MLKTVLPAGQVAAALHRYKRIDNALPRLRFHEAERRYVAEYCVSLSTEAAAAASGLREDTINRNGSVAQSIEDTLAVREQNSELRAEYVREFVLDILELCPTDYFIYAPDGGWMIDPEDFKKLPHKVKRLVEGVELRTYRGQVIFTVRFLSKQMALALAARLTMTERDGSAGSMIPWDQVVTKAALTASKTVEEKLKDMEAELPPAQVPSCPEPLRPFSEHANGDVA